MEVTLTKKVFSYDNVLKASIRYFDGDELAATTWINKYCLKGAAGEYLELSPDDMHRRMAKEFYKAESRYSGKGQGLSIFGNKRKPLSEEGIYQLFKDFKYVIPQGSVMSVLGNDLVYASLSNCVVLHAPLDSYSGIFFTDQQLAQLSKRRCGVGFDISTLRPRGYKVANAAGSSSGLVSFMERFSNTTREVSQNGRRGALMLTIDVAHPDIEGFITAKQDLTKVTGANISVRISDKFMKAVEAKEEFILQWPVDSDTPEVTKKVDAAELWNKIITAAHHTAEPGIIFWDRQHHYSTSSVYPGFQNESTNPCSEIAMQGGDSCRLMALNLYSFVDNPFTRGASFNYNKFYEVTYEAQRLMDDLVDLELNAIERILGKIEKDPEPEWFKEAERKTWNELYENGAKGRRTGLGFTALADTIAALGLKLDSDKAIETIEAIMQKKCEAEFDSSIDMAIERGHFKAFDPEIEKTSEFTMFLKNQMPELYERMMLYGRRNISISTVAPTGSVSLLAQTSSGVEPVFMLSYMRRRKINAEDNGKKASFVDKSGDSWEEFEVYHPKLKVWMEANPGKNIEDSPFHGATAPEIDWHKRLQIQAVIQQYVTHSISSTINLANDTTVERVSEIYYEAWKGGLKGITVYRDGSRAGVLVKKEENKQINDIIETEAPKRPHELEARIIRFMNDHEPWLAFVGLLNEKPYEIFTGRAEDAFALPNYVDGGWIIKNRDAKGDSRYDFRYVDRQGFNVNIEGLSRSFNQEYWNYAKLISGIMRQGMPLNALVRLIENLNLDKDYINNWKNGVARALKKFVPKGARAIDHSCPSCGDENGVVYEEGCLKCKSCGHTTCG
ncbi:MAG: adenosylcobalamin-dependent ribonucleoside-diphosphate reductase [Candidatus Cyclobacteriaceae bacterium M2_1C_046]